MPHPDVIHRHPRCQGILAIGNPTGERQPPTAAGSRILRPDGRVFRVRLFELTRWPSASVFSAASSAFLGCRDSGLFLFLVFLFARFRILQSPLFQCTCADSASASLSCRSQRAASFGQRFVLLMFRGFRRGQLASIGLVTGGERFPFQLGDFESSFSGLPVGWDPLSKRMASESASAFSAAANAFLALEICSSSTKARMSG